MNNGAGRIVVGYDGSPHGQAALDWAAAEAADRGMPLTVVHVVRPLDLTAGPALGWPVATERVMTAAEVTTQEGVERARRIVRHEAVSGVTAYGTPASLLVETAEAAALLVVGSRGRGPVLAGLLGSVALGVTGHARCPVVVVPGTSLERPGPDRPVVVGVDGSAGSERALRHAADAAATASAPLVVVTAWRSIVEESWYVTGGTAFDGVDLDRSARTQAERVAKDAAALVESPHPELLVSWQVIRGAPADALARAGATLLVVGSRGHGGLAGLVLGSVSHALIHTAPCPVTVVPNR